MADLHGCGDYHGYLAGRILSSLPDAPSAIGKLITIIHMFTASLRFNQLTFSLADATQHPQVLALVHAARFRLIQFGQTTLNLPHAHVRMAVAWHHHKPVATVIATTATPAVAWIRCCALDGIHISDHDMVIRQLTHVLLTTSGITTFYYSSDHYDHWLADILVGVGFTIRGSIVATAHALVI